MRMGRRHSCMALSMISPPRSPKRRHKARAASPALRRWWVLRRVAEARSWSGNGERGRFSPLAAALSQKGRIGAKESTVVLLVFSMPGFLGVSPICDINPLTTFTLLLVSLSGVGLGLSSCIGFAPWSVCENPNFVSLLLTATDSLAGGVRYGVAVLQTREINMCLQ
jgi:hypothetical protein